MKIKNLVKFPKKLILGASVLLLNLINAYSQSPGTWNGATTIQPSPTLNSTYSLSNSIGIGILSPRAWQEIKYCKPASGSVFPGLILTYDNSCSNFFPPFLPGNIDDIAFPFVTPGGPEPSQILYPYSFLTGHHTNILQPLYQPNKSPLLWARLQNSSVNSFSGTEEYDTKFIVQSDGSVGINLADPRAALDVRGSQGYNRPVAIFGARTLGTGITGANGLFKYYTQQIHFVSRLSDNGYNRISNLNDQGMFFSDGMGLNGANLNGSFVFAPWAQESEANAVGGMKMDKIGNVEFHGTVRATRLILDAKWWSDFVFEKDYKLMDLLAVEQFIMLHKHLPNVPSEAEVLENGIDVFNMQAIQQQKIEELTLYLIQIKKELDAVKEELKLLKQ